MATYGNPHFRKRKAKRAHISEDAHHMALATLLDSLGVLWFHPPNEGKRSAYQRKRLGAMGLRRGVPDVIVPEALIYQDRVYSGLAIELKSENGRLTPEQSDWLKDLAQRGWLTVASWGVAPVTKILQQITWRAFQGAPSRTQHDRAWVWSRQAVKKDTGGDTCEPEKE